MSSGVYILGGDSQVLPSVSGRIIVTWFKCYGTLRGIVLCGLVLTSSVLLRVAGWCGDTWGMETSVGMRFLIRGVCLGCALRWLAEQFPDIHLWLFISWLFVKCIFFSLSYGKYYNREE